MILHRLMVPLTAAAIVLGAGQAWAQGAFPAPLPGQTVQPNDPAFPPVNGRAPVASVGGPPQASFPTGGAPPVGGGGFGAPPPQAQGGGPSEDCMKKFVPLREEAERRGKLIKAASDRHASPADACKLIGSYGEAELKMIKYVEANASKCGIPQQIAQQLKAGHQGTENMQKKVCGVAEQMQQRGPAGPSLSEVLGSSTLPEANVSKKGGSTFDTLNGNVLTR